MDSVRADDRQSGMECADIILMIQVAGGQWLVGRMCPRGDSRPSAVFSCSKELYADASHMKRFKAGLRQPDP